MSGKYSEMSAGKMLEALGADASKWADAFAEQHPEIDKGFMIGWFANAIENTWDVRCSRFTTDDAAWEEFKDQVDGNRRFLAALKAA